MIFQLFAFPFICVHRTANRKGIGFVPMPVFVACHCSFEQIQKISVPLDFHLVVGNEPQRSYNQQNVFHGISCNQWKKAVRRFSHTASGVYSAEN